MYKKMKYYLLYQYNCIRYRNKKVQIPFLEIWVGQCCNLRCKNCCHLIPYMEQKLYDIEQIIHDCQMLFELCEVEFFSIVGGEPFTHPELYRLMDFVAQSPNIKKGKIVTNGTILPQSRMIKSLKGLNGKLEIRIDGYPGIGIGVVEEFADIMKRNDIPYHFARFNPDKVSSWKQLTPDYNEPLVKKETEHLFSKCYIRDCNTLANGELTLCPRGIGSEHVFHMPKNPYEHVNIRELQASVAAKARIATCINQTVYKDYCKYCLSLSEKNDRYVMPGEQLSR